MGNLLFFASDYKIGLSSLLTDQLLALVQSKLNVIAVAGENEQEKGLSESLAKAHINVCRIQGLDQHNNILSLAKEIKRIVQDNNIQYIHVQNNWQLAIVTLVKYVLLRTLSLKVIYTIHGFRNNKPLKAIFAQIIIGTALFLFANRVICMSKYLVSKFRLLRYKISLIPLGVNDDFYDIENHDLPLNGLQMIFPAQFRYGKNQEVLIKAFANFINKTGDKESCLVLPGTGELQNFCQQLVSDLKIEERVLFPGSCSKSKIKDLYMKSNIGLISSNCETFGQSIVEPFVLGRCVISTHVGIADEIIHNGLNGFFFRTEEELESIFEKLYKNREFLKSAGEYNYVNRMIFNWKTIGNQYINMIKSL